MSKRGDLYRQVFAEQNELTHKLRVATEALKKIADGIHRDGLSRRDAAAALAEIDKPSGDGAGSERGSR